MTPSAGNDKHTHTKKVRQSFADNLRQADSISRTFSNNSSARATENRGRCMTLFPISSSPPSCRPTDGAAEQRRHMHSLTWWPLTGDQMFAIHQRHVSSQSFAAAVCCHDCRIQRSVAKHAHSVGMETSERHVRLKESIEEGGEEVGQETKWVFSRDCSRPIVSAASCRVPHRLHKRHMHAILPPLFKSNQSKSCFRINFQAAVASRFHQNGSTIVQSLKKRGKKANLAQNYC